MVAKEKVTLTLPADLMEAVRTLAPPRRQSQFIAEAIRYFVTEQQRKTLRERLIAGYQANAAIDVAIATEWSPLEDEIWQNYIPTYENEERNHDASNSAG
jgi:hypothetical protein